MRKIFLDCGAHDGCSVKAFLSLYPDSNEYEIYSIEGNKERYDKLKNFQLKFNLLSNYKNIKIIY